MQNSSLLWTIFFIMGIAVIGLIAENAALRDSYNEQLEMSYWDRSVIDSLHGELYVKELELGNYVQMWSILEDVAPGLADSIDNQVE
jgi:hypothetical protein